MVYQLLINVSCACRENADAFADAAEAKDSDDIEHKHECVC